MEFIRMQFTDISGQMKNVAITAYQIEKAVDNQIMIDGSSIEGFVRINESDQYLYPDLNTFAILPQRPQHGKVARLICDLHTPDGTPFEGDSRGVLKNVLKDMHSMPDPHVSSSFSRPMSRAAPPQQPLTKPATLTLVLLTTVRARAAGSAWPLRK